MSSIGVVLLFVSFSIIVIQLFPIHFFTQTASRDMGGFVPKIKPLLTYLSRYSARLKIDPYRRYLHDRLVCAGLPHDLTADETIALKSLSLATALLALLPLPWGALLLRLLPALAAFFLPDLWLKELSDQRRQRMVRLLPGFIDLLTLAVEAGMDFMAALAQVVGMSMPNPLVDEFKLTLEEVRFGATREEALRKMADRVRLPELNSFISSLLQANRLGTPLGRVLRIQAEEMRKKRILRAEKLAQEASVKIILPLVAFIFPCVLIILLGPLFLKILQGGF